MCIALPCQKIVWRVSTIESKKFLGNNPEKCFLIDRIECGWVTTFTFMWNIPWVKTGVTQCNQSKIPFRYFIEKNKSLFELSLLLEITIYRFNRKTKMLPHYLTLQWILNAFHKRYFGIYLIFFNTWHLCSS